MTKASASSATMLKSLKHVQQAREPASVCDYRGCLCYEAVMSATDARVETAKVPVRGAAGEQPGKQPAGLPHLEPLVGAQGMDDALDAAASSATLPSDYRWE
eukprot:scaffold85344_cov14-Tisochrysis_lutea.AAC.1